MTDFDYDSEDERALANTLRDAAARHQPPAGWEARVWARALRQQTAPPRRGLWMRRLVPVMALAALIGVSGVLGTALWRSRTALSNMQERVADERRAAEQLRQDLTEAQREARSARTETARLEALASVPPLCRPGTIAEHLERDWAAEPRELRREPAERPKAKTDVLRAACDPADPLCGL